jgi:membrane fusion protein, multidrug efflux system
MNNHFFGKACQFIFTALLFILTFTGCKNEEHVPVLRPVRSIIIEKHKIGDPIVLTGQLCARDEISLAFRLSGKLIERSAEVGESVRVGQIIARLDAEPEHNAKNAAQADYSAAQAVLEQAESAERRLNNLLRARAVSRTQYEEALRQLKTARAQVNAAKAKLNSTKDQLKYTELRAEFDGVITAKGAEPGEVVREGQMILLLARRDGRDAVFDIPAQVIRAGFSTQQRVDVWLADNPDIKTSGLIREVSPQADPATRTYRVKVGLKNASAGMFLGSTVVGRLLLQTDSQIEIPSSTLNMSKGKPAVWIVDPTDTTVHLQQVKVMRYTQDSVIVNDGLKTGERVITAGVQVLYEGQKIRLLGEMP